MLKNVGSQIIGTQMVSATDGSDFTGTVTVWVTVDNGTQTLGTVGSGVCAHKGKGLHNYVPSQAETNGDFVQFTFIGTGAVTVTLPVPTVPTTGLLAPTVAGRTLAVGTDNMAQADVAKLLGTAWLTPAVAGTPDVNTKTLTAGAIANATLNADIATTAYATNTLARAIWERLTSATFATGSIGKKLIDWTPGYVLGFITTALGETTPGLIAAAFKKFFDIASPTSTMNRITLVDTTTTNTDMRGTDSAALAATALSTAVWTPTLAGFIDVAISSRNATAPATPANVTSSTSTISALIAALNDLSSAQVTLAVPTVLQIQAGIATSSALATAQAGIDAIEADTNELQIDWEDGGRLDEILDGASTQSSVDDLPTNAELATALDAADDAMLSAISGLASTLSTISGYIDTEVAAIKAKTDNLPSDPADASDISTSFSLIASTLSTIASYIDTEVAAIKAKTDNLPASPASTSDITTAVSGLSTFDASTDTVKVGEVNSAAVEDIFSTYTLVESYAAVNTIGTPSQLLYFIQQVFSEFTISGTTISIKALSGSDEIATFTMDDATTPTLRGRTT